MTDEYAVDLEDIEAITARIRGYSGYLADNLDELCRMVASVTSNWSGMAADAFNAAHEDWIVSATAIQDSLYGLEQVSTIAYQSYSAAIDANAKMVGRQR